jgi:putative PIN family toxin of toxin-antitoxin system
VFFSGIFFSGPPYEVLGAWRDKKIRIVASPAILEEYQRVAETLSAHYLGVEIQPIIDLLIAHADLVVPERLKRSVCDDPHDDKFLECALVGKAEFIISGDKHLLKVSGYQ